MLVPTSPEPEFVAPVVDDIFRRVPIGVTVSGRLLIVGFADRFSEGRTTMDPFVFNKETSRDRKKVEEMVTHNEV